MQITPHAARRYRERVVPPSLGLTDDLAARELLRALEAPLFGFALQGGWLWGCRNASGHFFLAWAKNHLSPVETVGPPWFWHEARPYWQAAGITLSTTATRTQKRKAERSRAAARNENRTESIPKKGESIDFFAAAADL